MARLKTQTKELAILDAASRVFAARPFHEVLIDSIASDAGIGKGTIYRYFETKEDLYFATVVHVMEGLAAELEKVSRAEPSAARKLEAIATLILGRFWERRYLLPFFQRDERFPALEVELIKRREPILRVVQEAILAGIERREFRGIDARIGADLFLGMVRSMNLFHTSADRLEDLVGQLISVFVQGAGRRAEAETA
ncbi:MAG TPA: TetR/AcrR family transcriptional regulator [Thermoanaerobaculia bacterium]|nr:TetR/AcrR family transcriptional regulator [Thermoanaerobaculia bacterium]